MNRVRAACLLLGLALILGLAKVPATSAAPAPGSDAKERAVSALEEDLKTDPHNAELWLHLGFAYRKLDQIDKSQEAFEKATILNPNTKDAFFMLGLIYESKHRDSDAVQAWKSYMALETSPEKRDIAQKHIHHLNP